MPGQKRLIAAGVLALLLGLLILFPARVAYRWFVPPELQLSGITGTLWRGEAGEGTADGFYLGHLKWRFKPLSLLAGKAGFLLTADPVSGFIETGVAVGLDGNVSFSALDAALPMATFKNGIPSLRGIDGSITLQFESVVLAGGMPVEADGTLVLSNLVVRDLSGSPLGEYRAVFQTGDNGISGQVQDVSGVVDIDGTIQLRPDRSYLFSGQIAAAANAPSAMVQQLQYLGSPDAEGKRTFRFEGQL